MMARIDQILSNLKPGDKVVVEVAANQFRSDNVQKVGVVTGHTARQIRVEVDGQRMNFTKGWGLLVGGPVIGMLQNQTRINVKADPDEVEPAASTGEGNE